MANMFYVRLADERPRNGQRRMLKVANATFHEDGKGVDEKEDGRGWGGVGEGSSLRLAAKEGSFLRKFRRPCGRKQVETKEVVLMFSHIC